MATYRNVFEQNPAKQNEHHKRHGEGDVPNPAWIATQYIDIHPEKSLLLLAKPCTVTYQAGGKYLPKQTSAGGK